jgi:hypothetical protein
LRKLDEIALAHNARIARFRGLSVAYVSVMFNGQADIGFSKKERKLIGTVLPFLASRKIGTGLYARGKEIDKWVDLFACDDELCTALRTLLGGYAYSIEWTDSLLSARVSVYDGSIDGDATGGERFFANLDVVAARLSALADRGNSLGRSEASMVWGPAALRKVVLLTGFLVPFALLMV